MFKVRKAVKRRKQDATLARWLDKVSLPTGSSLPPDDPAAGYLAARMQFGGLTIPTPELITAVTLARHMLTSRLQVPVLHCHLPPRLPPPPC